MSDKNKKSRVFYGWFVAAACFFMVFTSLGLGNSPNGLYIVPVAETMGHTRSAVSAVITFRFASTATLNFFFGWFARRFTMRQLIGGGYAFLAAGFFILSRSESLPLFYFGGVVFGVGIAFSSTAVVSQLMEHWFREGKGAVMGFVLAGSGIGGSLFSILVSDWISVYTWKGSYLITAVCFAIFAVPLVLIVRNDPSEMDLKPWSGGRKNKKIKQEWEGPSFDQILKKPYFYIGALCVFLVGFLNNPVYNAASAHIADQGLNPDIGAAVLSIYFLALAVSKIFLGFLCDRKGVRLTVTVCCIATAIGCLILAFVRHEWMGIAFAILFSIGGPMETLMIPLMVAELYGHKAHSTILGIYLALSMAGMAIGNPALNLGYDLTGSYQGMLVAYAMLAFGVLLALRSILRIASLDREKTMAERQS